MNAVTLRNIRRGHTPEDVARAFGQARSAGFRDINMDIIAGLPGETACDFENTLGAVFGMGPESVTSHTLCIKRSSLLHESMAGYSLPGALEAEAMQGSAMRHARANGMRPYYLYRQKNTVGNLANTGYSKPGHECLYNIFEMSDCADVLAIGAGAVSKFIGAGGGLVERVFNVKNLLEYINRIDEMIDRKKRYLSKGREGMATDGVGHGWRQGT